jgi:hypothetical protein
MVGARNAGSYFVARDWEAGDVSWLARALCRTLGNADNLFGIREIAGKPRTASDLRFRFEGGEAKLETGFESEEKNRN